MELLKSIVTLPIDHIGFVFAKSRRQVAPREAGEMIRALRAFREEGLSVPLTVGVFVDPSVDELAIALREAPLDAVQLHGRESADFCRAVKKEFGVQVWRAVSVAGIAPEEARSETACSVRAPSEYAGCVEALLAPYADCIDALLLDAAGGGTGKTFEWNRIPAYRTWARKAGVPLLVAGGLHPGNVGELLRDYDPDGVDVSSGVETDGAKDIAKITAFVERVKRHEPHAASAG